MPQNMNYPGVYGQEIDDTSYVSVNNSTYIAVMGKAKRGPSNAKVLVSSPQELISTFGTPIVSGSYPSVSAIDYGIYAGLESLKETQNLWYVRTVTGKETYAYVDLSGTAVTSAGTGVYSPAISAQTYAQTSAAGYPEGNLSTDIYDLKKTAINGTLRFASIGPGSYGNNIAIRVETSATYGTTATVSATVPWYNSYDSIPNNSGSASQVWDKVFKVMVYVKADTDVFDATWYTNNSPIETYYCSTSEAITTPQGDSLFIEDVINGKSKYIYVVAKDLSGTIPAGTATYLPLLGGTDDLFSVATSDWSWYFGNRDTTPIDIILAIPTSMNAQTSDTTISSLVSKRLDVIALSQVGAVSDVTLQAIKTAAGTATTIATPSYQAKYVGWNLVQDTYNSCRVMLPNVVYAGAVMARVDRIANVWEAPAGQDYGIIPSGRQNFTIDPITGGVLYDLNLNSIKFVRGIGNTIWGQKTAQLKKTYRDRINVRRLLLKIEKDVEVIANAYMFKGNTQKLRERVAGEINSYLQNIKVKGGLEKYKVVCDATNNPQSSIDAHILNIGVYVMPTQTIEFILVTTVVTNSGVVFTEAQ